MTNNHQTILIIDDDQRNIFALQAVLKSRGFTSASATRAEDGLNLLTTRNDIGVVLLDMMMPEMDGYETLERIRKSNYKNIPVVAVTAQAMAGDREKCLAAGADEYISKPIDVDVLSTLLTRLFPTKL